MTDERLLALVGACAEIPLLLRGLVSQAVSTCWLGILGHAFNLRSGGAADHPTQV